MSPISPRLYHGLLVDGLISEERRSGGDQDRTILECRDWRTPICAFEGTKVAFCDPKLPIFGQTGFVLIPEKARTSKLEAVSQPCIFLGVLNAHYVLMRLSDFVVVESRSTSFDSQSATFASADFWIRHGISSSIGSCKEFETDEDDYVEGEDGDDQDEDKMKKGCTAKRSRVSVNEASATAMSGNLEVDANPQQVPNSNDSYLPIFGDLISHPKDAPSQRDFSDFPSRDLSDPVSAHDFAQGVSNKSDHATDRDSNNGDYDRPEVKIEDSDEHETKPSSVKEGRPRRRAASIASDANYAHAQQEIEW